jgi:translation initiation factor IF-3
MTLPQALQHARDRNLDLVEVAPTASPPVCRLMDYARWKYEQAKKEREARKNQKLVLVKEVRFRPKIDDHDIDFKVKQILRFLAEGDKVKISVLFRGREVAHPQIAKQLLDNVVAQVRAHATIEKPVSLEGRAMSLVLAPLAAPTAAKGARESRESTAP